MLVARSLKQQGGTFQMPELANLIGQAIERHNNRHDNFTTLNSYGVYCTVYYTGVCEQAQMFLDELVHDAPHIRDEWLQG